MEVMRTHIWCSSALNSSIHLQLKSHTSEINVTVSLKHLKYLITGPVSQSFLICVFVKMWQRNF